MWRGALVGFLMLWGGPAAAIDRVILEVEELTVAGARAAGATLELDLTAETPGVVLKATRLELQEPRITLSKVTVTCPHVVVREPELACRAARVAAVSAAAGALSLQGAASYNMTRKNLELTSRIERLALTQLRALVAPWVSIPAALEGLLTADLAASGRIGALQARLDARVRDLNFSNEVGTVVAEKVAVRLAATAQQHSKGMNLAAKVESASGQTLAGPVLLDFGANPLELDMKGRMADGVLELARLDLAQKDLLTASGAARLHPGGAPFVKQARLEISRVQFPAAYTSFLQIALAATDFGTLEASGTARGAVEITDDAIARVDVEIDDLDLEDPKNQFSMSDLRGALHWAPGTNATVEPSRIAWSKTQAYGLKGGTAQLDFLARGSGFELTREARVPIFDGAVVVHSMAARNLTGAAAAELDFDAHIEPISMPLLSKAFGWPELSGQLAGRVPGLTYRNGLLALNGDFTANVFDGTITGGNFRLREPLGPWPRLYADITARRLDLELVTSTFSIGSITGRLDADLKGLELFNWSPVAFDARLYSTPGDRSPKLISQKAVTSISSIGGGSGGVTKALQSGVLRFFDRFRYDRIGINCQLRNEVCLMTGVEPRGEGYYIVKGWGIPRIDIIGNAGRVDWPQLMTQIIQGMRSENVIVH